MTDRLLDEIIQYIQIYNLTVARIRQVHGALLRMSAGGAHIQHQDSMQHQHDIGVYTGVCR